MHAHTVALSPKKIPPPITRTRRVRTEELQSSNMLTPGSTPPPAPWHWCPLRVLKKTPFCSLHVSCLQKKLHSIQENLSIIWRQPSPFRSLFQLLYQLLCGSLFPISQNRLWSEETIQPSLLFCQDKTSTEKGLSNCLHCIIIMPNKRLSLTKTFQSPPSRYVVFSSWKNVFH